MKITLKIDNTMVMMSGIMKDHAERIKM